MPAAERNWIGLVCIAKRGWVGKWTYGIAVQCLEQIYRLLEICDHFLLRCVRCVASGFQGANASPMLAPLMLPEALVVAFVVFPVRIHVLQQRRLTSCL